MYDMHLSVWMYVILNQISSVWQSLKCDLLRYWISSVVTIMRLSRVGTEPTIYTFFDLYFLHNIISYKYTHYLCVCVCFFSSRLLLLSLLRLQFHTVSVLLYFTLFFMCVCFSSDHWFKNVHHSAHIIRFKKCIQSHWFVHTVGFIELYLLFSSLIIRSLSLASFLNYKCRLI